MTLKNPPHSIFERRHYNFIAAIIADLPISLRRSVAHHFLSYLSAHNANFRPNTFLNACLLYHGNIDDPIVNDPIVGKDPNPPPQPQPPQQATLDPAYFP